MGKSNVNMEAFYTRAKANEGIKLPLVLPTGERTEHWLQIRGIDSDIFRAAEAQASRRVLEIAAIEDKDEKAKAENDVKADLLASLVIAWSFDQECTIENVKAFFAEAPQIANMVDRAASQRSRFFVEKSSNLQTTQNPNSSLTGDRKEASKR